MTPEPLRIDALREALKETIPPERGETVAEFTSSIRGVIEQTLRMTGVRPNTLRLNKRAHDALAPRGCTLHTYESMAVVVDLPDATEFSAILCYRDAETEISKRNALDFLADCVNGRTPRPL